MKGAGHSVASPQLANDSEVLADRSLSGGVQGVRHDDEVVNLDSHPIAHVPALESVRHLLGRLVGGAGDRDVQLHRK